MVLVLLGVGVMLAAGGQVFAHHSFSATYDGSKEVQVEGVVKEFVWRNPHSFLRLDVTGKDGATVTWTLEWGSISQLTHAQLTRTTLRPGDRLVVTGAPPRDESSPRLRIGTIRRPADNWSWSGAVD
ncbi:MAG: hypothetical protein A3I61_18670 [Acidobacteria bacterium RIFCSPLOWO2_02_FULL_68_18]|nr:MAG: hypothetical protein A3I61_18670 [Acidobacteria bacterium RIFCSPLOWO2_02_FULL_68_18]OFW48069.1 MAG: hypothetical protein A3G77_11285 [Acidobacteria bacterium RIFCSPLOWO2_12_FULL_68_19]